MLTDRKVLVQFFNRIAHLPREQWPISREETMTWGEYVALPNAIIADTRVRWIEPQASDLYG